MFANPRLCRLLGYTLEEIARTGIRSWFTPDEIEKVLQRFRDRQDGKSVPSTYETVFVTKDRQSVPVEITATLTTWQGEPAGLVFVHDISERKAGRTGPGAERAALSRVDAGGGRRHFHRRQ